MKTAPEKIPALAGAAAFLVVAPLAAVARTPAPLYINYAARVDPQELAIHDVSIIHPEAETDLAPAHRAGNTVLAYLSAVEIEPRPGHVEEAEKAGVPVLPPPSKGAAPLADVSTPAWGELLNQRADAALRRGFDGVFLDTVDSLGPLIARTPTRAKALRGGLIRAINGIRQRHARALIVVNRGFDLLDDLSPIVDGVLAESLYRTYDPASARYLAVPEADTRAILARLERARSRGLGVWVVDYVSPGQVALAEETARRIASHGFVPLVTTPDLFGRVLAPLPARPRRVAAIYGQPDGENGDPRTRKWPIDTAVSRFLQTPLEWMGVEVDYHDATREPLPTLDESTFGIVFDSQLEWPAPLQATVLEWLAGQKAAGRRIVFLGTLPFTGPAAREFFRLFDLQGESPGLPRAAHVVKLHLAEAAAAHGEPGAKPTPVVYDYQALRAPHDAEVIVGADFQAGAVEPTRRFDAIFTCSWGGAALFPYAFVERADNVTRWSVDPFAFLQTALQIPPGPVPDATTRDGCRLFFSHIDGDGFSNLSQVEKGRYAAEIIRDQVLKRYPVPITCSIIEAEIRGRLLGMSRETAAALPGIARSIFALPNVQIASHTYSHPFFWMEHDSTASLYGLQNLKIAAPFAPDHIDPEREIRGSIEYIRQELAPPGKPVDLLLWSGNCRPGPAAIAVCDDLGVENMNGGDTVISRWQPTISAVAPLATTWDGRLQIHAAAQNEMLFTGGFRGPRWGAFTNVIQTFERTESPRRLKPVNIYYHLFNGERNESLEALKIVYDWAMRQPLQALTAADYARLVRQVRTARVYPVGADRWLLLHGREMRTFRLPDNGLRPDLTRSVGIIGWNVHAGSLYVSTDAAPQAFLALSPNPPPHPFVKSSTAAVEVRSFTPDTLHLRVNDLRPVTIEIGGLAPSRPVLLRVNGNPTRLVVPETGALRVQTPPRGEIQLSPEA